MRGCTLRQTYSCSARLRHPAPTCDSAIALSRLSPLRTQHGNKVDNPKIDNIVFYTSMPRHRAGRWPRVTVTTPHTGGKARRALVSQAPTWLPSCPSPARARRRRAPRQRVWPRRRRERSGAQSPTSRCEGCTSRSGKGERSSCRRPPRLELACRGYKDGDRCLCGVRIEAGTRSSYYPIPLLRQGCALHLSFLQRRSLFILRAKHERENTSLTIACAQRRV